MSEVPDLLDGGGRMRRIVLSLLIGIAGGSLAYFVANTLIDPEPEKYIVTSRQMGRDTFVIWVTLIAAVISFVVALTIQNRLAANKWRQERVPQARVR